MSQFYGRRRRPTLLILLALVVFTFLYTSNRLYSSSIPNAPAPIADTRPAAQPPAAEPVNQDAKPDMPEPASPPPAESPKTKPDDKKEDDKKPSGPADKPMSYGTASRPEFGGGGKLIKMGTLPAEYLPSVENGKRLVFVGDVHGMIQPLQSLLAMVSFDGDSGRDHLVFTGNMVSKGPDSAAVVELAMSLKASAVRGVHEDRVLLANDALNATTSPAAAADDAQDTLEQEHLARGDYEDRTVAEALNPSQIDWLASHPVILDVGVVPTLQHVYVSHAGLVPGLPLEQQDPWPAMHMRSIVYPREQLRRETAKKKITDMLKKKGDGDKSFVARKTKDAMIETEFLNTSRATDKDLFLPVDDYSGDEWSALWNEAEGKKPEGERQTIVYGHDIKKGLNIGRNSFGINTNCVSGGKLTALVLSGSSSGTKFETFQVDCEEELKADEIPL